MQNEIDLVHKMNRELGAISEKIESLNDKIAENHQLHEENREDIKEILVTSQDTRDKVAIQNGRVTSLEKFTEKLAIVESQNSGMIKAIQDNLKGTQREVNELNKYKDAIEGVKIENKKQFLGIGYNLIEKITWGIIILIATNIKVIVDLIYNVLQR